MSDIIRLDHIGQYNEMMGVETLHPLIGFVDCYKLQPIRYSRKLLGFYGIFVKDTKYGELQYGRGVYDYQEGSVVFVAPGQIMGSPDDGQYHQAKGYVLMFHPDLLRGTSLANCMKDYTFFSYDSNEALHLSMQERKIVLDCFEKIQTELQHPIDKHTKSLIVDNIKLFLDYSLRFYDRQFITREHINTDILARFEKELNRYFDSDLPDMIGLPSVQYFADKFHLSTNYFSDLIRKKTGMNALKHIHLKLLDMAKTKILNSEKSFSEIAYELGFKYPQHFSRFFKKEVGVSPNDYRKVN
jgi:AraC-like DNA-binding protein